MAVSLFRVNGFYVLLDIRSVSRMAEVFFTLSPVELKEDFVISLAVGLFCVNGFRFN